VAAHNGQSSQLFADAIGRDAQFLPAIARIALVFSPAVEHRLSHGAAPCCSLTVT
jgi:hypothetical protein